MLSFLKRAWKFLRGRYAPRGARFSFAGAGEDLIIADLLKKAGVAKPQYIDIGAYHPVFGSNTYYFYRQGGKGVLVEPDTKMCELSIKKRPRDICLPLGGGGRDGEADFYSFTRNTRSTFSKEEAEAWEKSSGERALVSKRRMISLDRLVEENFDKAPDLISLDTEGYEVEILEGFSFKKKPQVFCIEVVSSTNTENQEVYTIMEKHGYRLAGKTSVNAIFSLK